MLGILLDAAVIMLAIYIVNQGQQMDLGPAVIAAIVIGVGGLVCTLVIGPSLLIVIPLFAIAVLAIWMISGIPLGRAAIAAVIFTVCKIAISFAYAAAFA